MDCFKDFMTNCAIVRSGSCLRERVWRASGWEMLSVVLFRRNKKVYKFLFCGDFLKWLEEAGAQGERRDTARQSLDILSSPVP